MDELNAAIERLCEAKGFHFKTFECPPWETDDGPCPGLSIRLDPSPGRKHRRCGAS